MYASVSSQTTRVFYLSSRLHPHLSSLFSTRNSDETTGVTDVKKMGIPWGSSEHFVKIDGHCVRIDGHFVKIDGLLWTCVKIDGFKLGIFYT
jgi:hypothetical protein